MQDFNVVVKGLNIRSFPLVGAHSEWMSSALPNVPSSVYGRFDTNCDGASEPQRQDVADEFAQFLPK
ncbi:hypothetical protein KIN20_010798 [Parelaphostrongylus tenuis]|uniref:Uncharacterized protein n=1 Tax=Parelaphostrongylus tenuis TaxID=148309 RepID=A0AAD5M8F0_PARTN|nr:hypothetical protein KIN20_010798 [Parelaphostrongylus tenuis]